MWPSFQGKSSEFHFFFEFFERYKIILETYIELGLSLAISSTKSTSSIKLMPTKTLTKAICYFGHTFSTKYK
jgi:hypothetical protein